MEVQAEFGAAGVATKIAVPMFTGVIVGTAPLASSAMAHPVFGPIWEAAFAYCDPAERLDFSDTGEPLFLLGLEQMPIDEFGQRFLSGSP